MSDLISSNPDIRGGEPVIAGIRFPVWQVQEMHDNGTSAAGMIEDFPALRGHEAGIAAAIAYPRRRVIPVYDTGEGVRVFEIRESTIRGYVDLVAVADDETVYMMAYSELPPLIAALEHARGWEAGE